MTVSLPVYNSSCTDCKLSGSGCSTVCMSGRKLGGPAISPATALLVVGEAPGADEDKAGQPFVGKSGQILINGYLAGIEADQHVDVYLTNAVRCRPPKNATPLPGNIRQCGKYLVQDIQLLRSCYQKVVILAVGSVAARALGHKSLSDAFAQQGADVKLSGQTNVVGFYTYHPAYILRDPTKLSAVEPHLLLLKEYLLRGSLLGDTTWLKSTMARTPIRPPTDEGRLEFSLDIETYGAIAGQSQTQFHPANSLRIDKPNGPMVKTASICWTGEAGRTFNCTFDLRQHADRLKLKAWLARDNITIVGMNLLFDLRYLLAENYVKFDDLLRDSVTLVDIAVSSFCDDDARPERSLKSLAPLFNILRYNKTAKNHQFTSSADNELQYYNAQDAYATLKCHELLGTKHYNVSWWSELLKTTLSMELNGIRFDVQALSERLRGLEDRRDVLEASAKSIGFKLFGTGSGKDAQTAIEVAAGQVTNDVRAALKLTDKTAKFSTSQYNVNLLLKHLPVDLSMAHPLQLMADYSLIEKGITTEIGPLLNKWTSHDGWAYPTWYTVPTHLKDDQGSTGGTRQGRITCKNPAFQVLPKDVRKMLISRWPGGRIIAVDYSQIELRMAALLSRDPVMCNEYQQGIDRHLARAVELFGNITDDNYLLQWQRANQHGLTTTAPERVRQAFMSRDPDALAIVRDHLRQVGKTINFLILFKGQAFKAHETILNDLGLDLSMVALQTCIQKTYARYSRFSAWQDEQVRTVETTGYLKMWSGLRRTFKPDWLAGVDLPIPEIVNFQIQALAAQYTQSAQYDLMDRLRVSNAKSVAILNQYDSVFIDVHPDDNRKLLGLIDESFDRPSIDYVYQPNDGTLPEHLRVPLKYGVEHISGSQPIF